MGYSRFVVGRVEQLTDGKITPTCGVCENCGLTVARLHFSGEKFVCDGCYYKYKEYGTEEIEFYIKCKMRRRWVPYFLGMLKKMQYLGGIGSSKMIRFLSDGDGDFRPKFEWDDRLPSDGKPRKTYDTGEEFYDAG